MKRPTPSRTIRAAQALGENLSTWRKLQGLTMQQVAEKSNTTRGTLSRLEHGDPSVSMETFLTVCNVFGVLDAMVDAVDPYMSDYGRLRADQTLPQRVRR